MDNNLKDFLESANSKFNPDCDENEVNVLLVGCNDPRDIQNWVQYLYASSGFFTSESYVNHSNYCNVDFIALTNLYFKHKNFHSKRITGSWDLSEVFTLCMGNPYRKKSKHDAMLNFHSEIGSCNSEIEKYKVPGEAPDFIKEVVKIPHFIHDFLENQKGIYLFEKKEKQP